MDEVRNNTNVLEEDARVPLAGRIFEFLQNRDEVCMRTDPIDHVSRGDEELLDRNHLISGIACRCVTRDNMDQWQLETIWENVDLSHIDIILVAGEYEWLSLDGIANRNDVSTALIQDINAVLLRHVYDWSHPEGNVWCQHIVWSGNFADGERVLQLSEDNSNTPSIRVIRESYCLYPQLREPYIRRHSTHPTAATIAAVESCRQVILSEKLVSIIDGKNHVGTSDGKSHGLLCAICHEVIPIGLPAT